MTAYVEDPYQSTLEATHFETQPMQVGESLDHAPHVHASLSGLAHYLAGSTFIPLFYTHTLHAFCG